MSALGDQVDEPGEDELRVLEATRQELYESMERTHELIVEARHTLESLSHGAPDDMH